MNIAPLQTYKVIEHDTCIAIIPPEGTIRGANNLIIADLHTCMEYLHRYTEQRLAGKEIPEAHEIALRGARIIKSVLPS